MTHRKPYHRWILLCMVLIFGGLVFSALAQDSAGRGLGREAGNKRIALVIGNASYKDSPLKNPVNDAKDMALTLRKLGFDVIEKTDANQKDMNRAIVQFGEKLRADTVALFFYAGHGMQVKGKNYIIPVDAHITGEASVRAETVDVDSVMDQLAVSPMNIVILDACRNNPFERKFRSTSGGLAQMDAPKGSLIAYATAPGKTAADGDGRNGLYTQELLKYIQVPGLTLEAVFKRVRNGVMSASADNQTPWESSSMTGDFYFFGPTTVQVQGGTSTADPETHTWDAAQSVNSAAAYQTYLDSYPQGRFVSAAKIKLGALKAPAGQTFTVAPVKPTPTASTDHETQFWNEVKTSGAREYLDAYLKQYPKGKYTALARVEIRKLDDQERASQARAQAEAQMAQERERQEAQRAEQTTWEDAKSSNTAAAYSAYLSRYPQGRYATLAYPTQQRLQREEAQKAEQLKQQQAEAAQREETDAWDKAQAANTVAALTGYLSRYPQGRFAAQALPERQRLQREEAQRAEQQAALREEQEAWRMVETSSESAAIQRYLDRYPAGSNAGLAQTKLAQIKRTEAEMRPGKVFKDCAHCPEMVVIPAGSGIAAMAMGQAEVTQGQWQAVMGNNPSGFKQCGNDCPVEQVSWDDAQVFIQKLNAKTGKTYRLPTEQEWAYACLGGQQTEYCGGNNVNAVAWYWDNSGETTQRVRTKQGNGFGLYDMSGNVWEWTDSCWEGNCGRRVLRGGSWGNGAADRAAVRLGFGTAGRNFSNGFRLARMLP